MVSKNCVTVWRRPGNCGAAEATAVRSGSHYGRSAPLWGSPDPHRWGAVEYYTFGGYSTKDTDLAVADINGWMKRWSTRLPESGTILVAGRSDSVVEAPAGVLAGEEAPLTAVEVDGLTAFVLGVEDLTIDRLNGFVHWHWKADGRWAERLIALHGADMDWAYLHRRALAEGTDAEMSCMEKAWQEGRLG